MPSQALAKKAFKEAREFYESGLKSGNKTYEVKDASWWKRISGKAKKRKKIQPDADKKIIKQRNDLANKTILMRGQLLYKIRSPAANCGELAQVTCHLLKEHGASIFELAVAEVYSPNLRSSEKGADHALCLYGETKELEFIKKSQRQ